MKFLILVSAVLSVALASWEPVHEKYHGPLHYPKIHKGVPVEPVEVQHARDAHLEAVAHASHNHGYEHHDEHHHHEEHHNEHHGHHEEPKWHGPLHYPVIHKGVPVETLEVQHARAAHLKAVSGGAHTGDYHNYDNHHHHEIPVIGHNGKPLDTHEVEAAKAKHFSAVHEALARTSHYRKRRGAESYVHVSNVVEHSHPIHVEHHETSHHSGSHGYSVNQKHAPVYGHHESHHHQLPVIGHDGTPLDTPEVQHAKAAHLAAYHKIAHGYFH